MKKHVAQITGVFAIAISNKNILMLFAIINLGNFLVQLPQQMANFLKFPATIFSFICIPIIYAFYFSMIYEKGEINIINISKKYLVKYYLLTLIISSPLIILLPLNIFIKNVSIVYILYASTLIISIAEIYILPYFFKSEEIIPSIKNGLQFLFNNSKLSTNLISMTFLSVTLSHYMKYSFFIPLDDISIFKSFIGFIIGFFDTILMFYIFILSTIVIRSIDEKNTYNQALKHDG